MIDQTKDEEMEKLVEQLAIRLTETLKNLSTIPQQYLSIKDTAKYTGLSHDYIRDQITKGLLPASDVGTPGRSTWRLSIADIDKFMQDRKAGAIAAPTLRNAPRAALPPSSHFRQKK